MALRCGSRSWTWGELCSEAGGWQRGLASRGVGPGDRVAIVAGSQALFVAAYLGVLATGAVAVPLNPASPPAELSRELAAVGAKAAVGDPGGAAALADLGKAGAGPGHVLVPGSPAEAGPGSSAPGPGALEPVPRERDDLAVLLFTSGTAGSPKPAMLTHGNLLANQDQVLGVPAHAIHPDDRCLAALPLFHIYGLNVVLGLALATGAGLVLLARGGPSEALAAVEEHQVSVVAGAPPMFAAWAGTGEAAVLRSVRLAVSGGAALPREVAERFTDRFGIPLGQGYGLTEASPVVASTLVDGRAGPGSVGAPLPGLELRLVDEGGGEALPGDPGEIWVRGPNVFAGYWGAPGATARVLGPDGWLHTGDVAVVDGAGSLHLVNRAKDLIVVSGFNVFPGEVEAVLAAHPAVAEAAVAGFPDRRSGEAVRAYVVPAPGADPPGEKELIDHCARYLARYKCPVEVVVADALPRIATGEVLRRALGRP